MKRIILLAAAVLFPLSKADVSLYIVEGLNQYPIEAKTIAHWCEENLQSPPGQATDTSDVFGVLYDSLVKNVKLPDEPLPSKITFKNYLKINGYYAFTPVQEPEEEKEQVHVDPFAPVPEIGESLLPVWLVMDQHGHVVLSFKFYYAKSGAFPRAAATCVMARYYYQPSRTLLTWDRISVKEQPGEWILYKLDKTKKIEQLLVLSRGPMALYPSSCSTPLFDCGAEEKHPTAKQTDLIPILREFIDIQIGRKKDFTNAREEILTLLPKAKKLGKAYRDGKLKPLKPLPLSLPKPKAPSFLPGFEEERKKLAELLQFPAAEEYKPSKDSGPDPDFIDHCREDWLNPFKISKVYKESGEYAAVWYNLTLSPSEEQRTHLIIAQCGTRALALQTLARMRLWQARKQQGKQHPVTSEEVAGQTNTSTRLVGDYALHLKGSLDRFGNLSPNGQYSSIFFLRGTTAVCLVSANSARSVLPLAKKLDAELKKLKGKAGKYQEKKPVYYITPEDAEKYKEFLDG